MTEAAVIELISMLETQPRPSDEDWYSQAVCPETDPDAFFPEKGGSTADAKKSLPWLPGQRPVPAMGARQRRALRRVGRSVRPRAPPPQAWCPQRVGRRAAPAARHRRLHG